MQKKLLFALSLTVLLGIGSIATAASITLNNPLCPTAGASGCVNNVTSLITTISTYLTTIIGSIAVIIFIWAGILFVTSAGDPGKIADAKRAVMYALIGLAISLAGSGLILVVRSVIGTPPSTSSTGTGTGGSGATP